MANEIALSSMESEYMGECYTLQEVILIMNLMKEMQTKQVPIPLWEVTVHCQLCEDNSRAMEMLKVENYQP
jgi:hypothetical protein